MIIVVRTIDYFAGDLLRLALLEILNGDYNGIPQYY